MKCPSKQAKRNLSNHSIVPWDIQVSFFTSGVVCCLFCLDTSQGYKIGGPGCTTFAGNMSRIQERPKDFVSTDTETSASGNQALTDGWAGSKQLEKLGDILGN